jgi:outer membrane receptor protein involved in Fe transport
VTLRVALLLLPASLVAAAPTVARGEDVPATDEALPTDEAPPADTPDFETVVVGRRPSTPDVTQDTVQVDGERLRDSSRGSTLEALSQEAGDVYVSGRGVGPHGVASGSSGGIHVRGLGGSPNTQVLVVEDGVPDAQGIFGHPIPDAYVPYLVEDAALVRGGDSVLYGTNAMGGAIVLRSRWLERDGYELENDAAFGSYTTIREAAAGLARIGDWDVAAAFSLLDTEGHRAGADGGVVVGQLAARLRVTDGLRLTLREKVVHLTGGDPGPASHPYADRWYDVWRDNVSLSLDYAGDSFSARVQPYFNAGVHELYDGFRSEDYTFGTIAEARLSLNRFAEMLAGLDVGWVGGDVENRITGERPDVGATTDVALYHQLTVRPVEGLTAVLGAREVFSTTWDFAALVKAGLRWDVWEGLYLHSRVTRNYRRPTLRELYLPYPTANPELRPEFALNWDFGIGWRSGHVDVSCTGYRTEARDLIRTFGAWPSAETVNVGKIRIWGVEGRVALERLGPVALSVAGGWQVVGRHTRQNPEAKLDFTLEAGQDFGPHFVGGSVRGEWVHGLFMEDYGRRPIPDAFVMDLTARYRYTSAERGFVLEPYVFLRNFLDRDFAFIEGYPMPGFNFLAGLKVEL